MISIKVIRYRIIDDDGFAKEWNDEFAYIIESESTSRFIRIEEFRYFKELFEPIEIGKMLLKIDKDQITPTNDFVGDIEHEGGCYLNGVFVKTEELWESLDLG